MKFLIRLLITAAALWAAVALVPGIEHTGPWVNLLGVALVFGVVNAVIRPILLLLTCPLVLVTLGLFIFVLNALMLWLTGALSQALDLGFSVSGFFAALVGGLVVGLVSTALNIIVGDKPREREAR
jgi:putative membrane protein